MKICIQDPSNGSTYLLSESNLTPFAIDSNTDETSVDVLFVCPADTLVQELPASRMTDSTTPTVQIVDPDNNRSWILQFSDLQRFRVPTPPSDGKDLAWFAMPSAKEVLAAVPAFRRALVQHSS